jgi:hypothetical protein
MSSEPTASEEARDDLRVEPGPEIVPLKAESATNSLPPVGTTIPPLGDARGEALEPLEVSRRPRTRLVIASLAACGLILAIAGVRGLRTAQSSAEAQSFASSPLTAPTATASEPSSPSSSASALPNLLPKSGVPGATEGPVVWSNTFPGTEVAAPSSKAPSPTSGTLLLRRPATAGNVWLDGAKVKEASVAVKCGAHEIRVGAHGHPHPIDVPCGGELAITQ